MPALRFYGQRGAWCKHGWSSIGNGQKVQTAILKDGDRLSVGPYVLVFEIANAQHTYKPVMEIDVSDNASQQTMSAPRNKRG